MNREEIENRIILCEYKANAYREVNNTKSADRYDNEKYKWEKLLRDLDLLNERKINELLEYKKGYFNLETKNNQLKEKLQEKIKENKELIERLDGTSSFRIGNAQSKIKDYEEFLQIIGGNEE